MKKFILLLTAIIFLISANLFAQEQRKRINIKSNEDFFNNSKYIVEGKLLKKFYNYDAKGLKNINDVYTEILFVVSYVYKDKENKIKTNDTITIVRNVGGLLFQEYDEESGILTTSEQYRHYDDSDGKENLLPRNSKYYIDIFGTTDNFIFFLNDSDYPKNPNDSINNKYLKTRFLENSIPSGFIIQRPIRGLIGLSFKDRYELYKYLKQFKDIQTPEDIPEGPKRDLYISDMRDVFISDNILHYYDYFMESEVIIEGYAIYENNKKKQNNSNILKFVVNHVYKSNKINDGDTVLIIRDKNRDEWNYLESEEIVKDYIKNNNAFPPPNEFYEDRGLFISSEYPSIIFCTEDNADSSADLNYYKVKLLQDKEKSSLKSKDGKKFYRLKNFIFDDRNSMYNFFKENQLRTPNLLEKSVHENDEIFKRDSNEEKRIDSVNKILNIKYQKAKENTDIIKKTK